MPLPPAPGRRAAKLSPEAFLPVRGAQHADPLPADDLPDAAEAVAAAAPRKRKQATAPASNNTATAAKPAPARGRNTKPASPAPAPAPASATAAPANRQRRSTDNSNATAAPSSTRSAKRPSTEAKPAALLAAPVRPRRTRTGPKTLFVLDTNVLLHDPTSLFRFEEHDIFLPMVVLEELDGHKKGMTEVARNGRQVSRTLDSLVASQPSETLDKGLPLNATGQRSATGMLYFQTEPLETSLPDSLPQGKADNQILGVVAALRKKFSEREVVLVSKDINMRVKARALGLAAEDYQNDKVLDDGDLLYAGALALPQDFWAKAGKNVESWQEGAITYYRISGAIVDQLMINQFVYHEAPGEPSLFMRVTEIRDKTAVLKTLKDFGNPKYAVWGVTARNREQNFAMNLLMNPDIDLVTLTGTAGTGKTLLALAAGLSQVLDDRRYTEIIMTRATVSVGEDIGFLPGTEEEKMGPWMGALDDNLEFLAKGDGGNAGEWGRAATNELIRSRIKIKSMNFMRGRTFLNKYVIIDEAQNLTPKQMKTLITRAGPGTKIICMGNLAQIDTPYLTEGSSGLTYAVDRFKGWPHSGHITLARGERSRLADFASEVL
ncbi:PhoH family protein [Delftia acidovorans SPH-1]|uniref:PhoH family protein n=4 Tax=Delftia acidovorans TaxID=80866 RepID=A9BNF7_DELAS|nr:MULTISPECIES: PhoH family protein [Delftia]MBA4002977.1 PhoH family protein [Delftia sp.]ABX37852.1 PhoH family protein [Delftia acidovorans SPH-1]MCP4017422.1 PhoH family protein [Delftia sp.]MCP4515490.1 PhoH family protein [Delftia sp.]MCP4533140.1 PhoH family protein [Delftia sp.]